MHFKNMKRKEIQKHQLLKNQLILFLNEGSYDVLLRMAIKKKQFLILFQNKKEPNSNSAFLLQIKHTSNS
jgi:hypothetical protein